MGTTMIVYCRSLGCEGFKAEGEALIWLVDDDKWGWFPYCDECLEIFERSGDSIRRWGVEMPVVTKQWRVNNIQLGSWPEIFDRLDQAEGDLAHCRESYPDHEFFLEWRNVGEWTRDET